MQQASRARHAWRRALGYCAPIAALIGGCQRETPVAPSEAIVKRAFDQLAGTLERSVEADRAARHQQRLREIDRVRLDSENLELQAELSILRGWLLLLVIVVLAIAGWLGLEIRRKRMLIDVIKTLMPGKEAYTHARSA